MDPVMSSIPENQAVVYFNDSVDKKIQDTTLMFRVAVWSPRAREFISKRYGFGLLSEEDCTLMALLYAAADEEEESYYRYYFPADSSAKSTEKKTFEKLYLTGIETMKATEKVEEITNRVVLTVMKGIAKAEADVEKFPIAKLSSKKTFERTDSPTVTDFEKALFPETASFVISEKSESVTRFEIMDFPTFEFARPGLQVEELAGIANPKEVLGEQHEMKAEELGEMMIEELKDEIGEEELIEIETAAKLGIASKTSAIYGERELSVEVIAETSAVDELDNNYKKQGMLKTESKETIENYEELM